MRIIPFGALALPLFLLPGCETAPSAAVGPVFASFILEFES